MIRCDNGPEYVSATLQNWASAKGIRLEYIQPGKPQQNAYVERFNRTVRYEWLSQYHWRNLDEVRDYATQWMWRYNHERPNMALGGITPKQRLAMAAQLYFSEQWFKGGLPILHSSGWQAVNWMIFPALALILVPLLWQAARKPLRSDPR